jgi:F-type H+-transporting ATPase subunit b
MDFILDTLGKVGFEWKMALFNLINFLIIFLILKVYAFGPLANAIAERKKKAVETVEAHTKAKTELMSAETRAQRIIDEAKVEASKLVEAAHDDASAHAESLKAKAKKEIELLINQAKRNIEIDKEDMKEALRKETIAVVIAATEKILSEKLDANKDAAVIESMISKLS